MATSDTHQQNCGNPDKIRELARMAYRRKGYKELTHLIATDTDACLEYDPRADMSEPLSMEERTGGMTWGRPVQSQAERRLLLDADMLYLPLHRRGQD